MSKRITQLLSDIAALALCVVMLVGCGSAAPVDNGGTGVGDGPGSASVRSSLPEDQQVNEPYEVAPEDVELGSETGVAYVRGVLLVYFEPAATQAQRDAAVELVGGEVIGRMDAFDEYQVRVDAAGEEALEALRAQLESADGVDMVTLDHVTILGQDAVANDPWDGAGLGGSDASWWAEAVSAPEAWECYDDGSLSPVTVAVVDSGFDLGNEDLSMRARWASDADAANRNARNHGTHVAGILGAAADNGYGICGMVWRGDLLCFDASSSTGIEKDDLLSESALELGLFETVKAGARVINFSNGSSRARTAEEWPSQQELVDSAGRAYSRRMGALLAQGHDFVVVQSAGNGDKNYEGVDATYNNEFASITADNCDSSYVAADEILDRVIIVAAAERMGEGYRLTSFSNGGPSVDVCAPGQHIYSTIVGGCDYLSGTSMAAPIVSGVAALVWAADPGLSGREVKQLVCMSAVSYADGHPQAHYAPASYPLVDAETATYSALGLVRQDDEPPVVEEEGPATDRDPLACFERYLRDIYDSGTVGAGTVELPGDGSDIDTYRQFAIGDFDDDGEPELLCVHEVTGEYGNSFGCLNDVIECDSSGNAALARRSITSFVPSDVSWPGTGWLCLYGGGSSVTRVYIPASDALAATYDLPETSYISLERLGDAWHLLTCSAFSVDADQVLDDASYGQVAAELEGAAPSPVPLQPLYDEAIDAVSPTA